MGGVLSFLSGPFKAVLDGVGGILGKVVTTDKDRLALQLQLDELAHSFTLQMAALDQQFAVEQAKVIVAETQSASWMARNWRPSLMYVFMYIIAHNFIVSPIFHLPFLPIPEQMWDLLKIGMGGYIFGRTAEKTIPQIVDVMKKK